mmetsp:Transcript_67913/g.176723  ORF Transcript_67913/g.176723 Transcript_67913/m.176723 type:complete len:115 (+) Transcript_67913:127-471(+)
MMALPQNKDKEAGQVVDIVQASSSSAQAAATEKQPTAKKSKKQEHIATHKIAFDDFEIQDLNGDSRIYQPPVLVELESEDAKKIESPLYRELLDFDIQKPAHRAEVAKASFALK